LANGNRVLGVDGPLVKGIHRLAELDGHGKMVWEALFEGHVGGLVVWPLVRAGFRSPSGIEDMDSPAQQVQALLTTQIRLKRLLAIQSLKTARHDASTFRGVVEALDHTNPRVREGAAEILFSSSRTSRIARGLDREPPGRFRT
jgi:hypothetical protein